MLNRISRRTFVQTAVTGAALAASGTSSTFAQATKKRRFTLNLNVDNIGVKADPFEAIQLARRYGYESVSPMPWAIEKLSAEQLQRLVSSMKEAGLKWGAASIGSFFDPDNGRVSAALKETAATAGLLQRIAATRCMTWALSSSKTLTYRHNWQLHVRRIREMGRLLQDHGLRLGIEYLGTKTLSWRGKFPFLRTLAELRELIADVGLPNIGVVLDAWHWWQAGDNGEDILKLGPQEVVTADICDAPPETPREQLPDSPRRLPCTTGVIDLKPFLAALVQIGYDGPVGTEPFDKSLGQLPTDEAMATATAAMKKALARINEKN